MKNNQHKFEIDSKISKEISNDLIHQAIEWVKVSGNSLIVTFKMDNANDFIDAYEYVKTKVESSKHKVVEISKSAKSFSFDVDRSIGTPIFKMIKEKYSTDVKIKRSSDPKKPSRISVPIRLVSTIYEGMSLAQKIQKLISDFRTPHLLKQIGSQLDRECPMYKTHDFPLIKGSEMIAKGILEDGKGGKIHPDKKYYDDDAEKVKLPKKVQLKDYYSNKILETYYTGEEEIIKVGGWNKVYEVVDQAYRDAAYRKQTDIKTKFMESPLNPALLKTFGLLPSDRPNVFMGHGIIVSLSQEFGIGIKKSLPFLNEGVIQYNYSNSHWVHKGDMTNQLVSDYSEDVITAKKMLDIGFTVNLDKSSVDYIYMESENEYAVFDNGDFNLSLKSNDKRIFNDKYSFLVIKERNNSLTERVLKWMDFKTSKNKDGIEIMKSTGIEVQIDASSKHILDIVYSNGDKRIKSLPITVSEFILEVGFDL